MQISRREFLLSTPLLAAPVLGAADTRARRPSFESLLTEPVRLVFADEFDDGNVLRINENATGGKPGAPAWRSRYRHPRKDVINQEKQIYVDAAFSGTSDKPLGVQPFSIANSVLTIRAQRSDPARVAPFIWNYGYTSGCITSELTHSQTYGYFEMRARLPVGRGFWPAFWLLPKRPVWPPEIDIFEGSGAQPDKVFHNVIEAQPGRPGSNSGWMQMPPLAADGFRVFGLEWTRTRIAFIVDGRLSFEYRNHQLHEDMYMLANLALGSHSASWIPDPDASTPFPGEFQIDYIRAFARAS